MDKKIRSRMQLAEQYQRLVNIEIFYLLTTIALYNYFISNSAMMKIKIIKLCHTFVY